MIVVFRPRTIAGLKHHTEQSSIGIIRSLRGTNLKAVMRNRSRRKSCLHAVVAESLEPRFLLSLNPTFQAQQTYPVGNGNNPVSVASADFNGDGKQDIVTENANGTISVLLGNGNGTFQSPLVMTVFPGI